MEAFLFSFCWGAGVEGCRRGCYARKGAEEKHARGTKEWSNGNWAGGVEDDVFNSAG